MEINKIRIGIIGLGRMGRFYLNEMKKSNRWDILYICDIDPRSRELAQQLSPESIIVSDEQVVFEDPRVQAVGLFTLANLRARQIRKALQYGKHILSEKPIADTIEDEQEMVRLTEASDRICTVNLYLRNSWYHHQIKNFIQSGELGELAIIRICHMTPGLVPGEGHEHEGPAFHDCGMHYVDIARWYAESEYATWHAQAVKMWNYQEPWWLQCHGTFQNGITFDITQGFVYGQLAKDQTHNSYIDIIGTKGIARMTHDFKTAVVELLGRRVFFRVGGIDAVNACPFQHDIRFDFNAAEAGAGISREERIARSGRHDDHLACFHALNGFPFVVEFADRFHADRRQYACLYACRYQCRTQGKAVDNGCQHAHLVAFYAIEAFVGATQPAENVSAADDDTDLYAQFMNFLNLCRIFGKTFFINAVLLFSHQAFTAEFQ